MEIQPRFGRETLAFDKLTLIGAEGQILSVTRLDFLVSKVEMRQTGGNWLSLTNSEAYVSGREGRIRFELEGVPSGDYDGIRFLVGLEHELNKSDPAKYPPSHALNPQVNGLHWGWQGGYVFLAIEGRWTKPSRSNTQNPNSEGGYSFHLANEPQLPLGKGR